MRNGDNMNNKGFMMAEVIVVSAIILVFFYSRQKFTKIMLVLLCCIFLSVLFILSLNTLWTVKLRMFFLINLVIIISLVQIINITPKCNVFGLSVCFFLLITLQIKNIYERHTIIEQRTQIWNEKSKLLQDIPNNGYVIWVWDQYLLNPFHIKEFHTKLYPWVWLTNFPMSDHHIGTSHRCLTNDNVFFCAPINPKGEYDCFNSYLSRKYGINTIATIFRENDKYAIIQLKE